MYFQKWQSVVVYLPEMLEQPAAVVAAAAAGPGTAAAVSDTAGIILDIAAAMLATVHSLAQETVPLIPAERLLLVTAATRSKLVILHVNYLMNYKALMKEPTALQFVWPFETTG